MAISNGVMLVDTTTNQDLEARPGVNDRILRKDEVLKLVGLGQKQLRLMVLSQQFPAHVKLGKRAIGWRLSDVQRWMQSLPQGEQQ
mgnify:CR=1 FL=1